MSEMPLQWYNYQADDGACLYRPGDELIHWRTHRNRAEPFHALKGDFGWSSDCLYHAEEDIANFKFTGSTDKREVTCLRCLGRQ